MIEPTGAPNPLDKQHEIESKCEAYSPTGIPVATDAFQILAPSR